MTMSYEITRTLHLHILVSLLVPCASCSLVFFFSLACFGTFFTLLRRPLTVIIPSKKHLMKLFIPRAHNWNFTVQIQYECWECCKTPHNYPEHQASFLHFFNFPCITMSFSTANRQCLLTTAVMSMSVA